MWKKNLLWLLLLCLPSALSAQEKISGKFLKSTSDKDLFLQAESLVEKGNYRAASLLYLQLETKYPAEQSLLFLTAVCLSYQPSTAEEALIRFEKTDRKRFYTSAFRLHYARALHRAYRFEEAIVQLEEYLREKHPDVPQRQQASALLAACHFAIAALKNPTNVILSPQKTSKGEHLIGLSPLLTPDEKGLFLTLPDSSGKSYTLFTTAKDSSLRWNEALPVAGLSTALPYQAVSLSADAHTLYFSGGTEGSDQQLFSSRKDQNGFQPPRKLYGNKLNSPWDESHLTVTPDGRTAYFSSNRPGGYGGYDLYRATLQADGSWGDVRNLGAPINSQGNEQTPFIHPSGTILLFSSDGHPGLGGYDFFRSDYQGEGHWSAPRNLGYPLNTPGDELHYVVSADGKTGYFASTAQGPNPIVYQATPGLTENDVKLLSVQGKISYNDQAVGATIRVNSKNSGQLQGIYQTQPNGRYFLYLPEGGSYTLHFLIADHSPEIREINFEKPDRYYDIQLDIACYSRDYVRASPTQKAVPPHTGNNVIPVLSDTASAAIPAYALKKKAGLIYKIQVGAYTLPKDFNYKALLKIGKVEEQKLDDGVTRFTIGHFETLDEAYKFRDKVIRAGIADAFVTAEYQQKRFLIKEILETGLLDE